MNPSIRGLLLLAVLAPIPPGCSDSGDDGGSGPVDDDDDTAADDDDDDDDDNTQPVECPAYHHPEGEECVADDPPPLFGTWHTEGTRILDPEGRQRILNGINLSNDAKRAPFASWATDPDYARLKEWGLGVLRLLASWEAIMPREGEIDAAYLDAYDQRVAWAAANRLLVIVDMHQDVFGSGFGGNGAPRWACDEALYAAHEPREPWYLNYFSPPVKACYDRFWGDAALQQRFMEAFRAVAARQADEPHVIGFDLFNEPNWGSAPNPRDFEAQTLQPFYERVMASIDEAAPGRLFFVEATTLEQAALGIGFAPFDPVFAGRVVYSPHYYLRSVHDNHHYSGDSEPIAAALGSFQATAERLDVPWWLGEWGGYTDGFQFPLYLRDVIAQLEGHRVGAAYYEYSPATGSFSPLNDDRTEKAHVVGVLARVYPKAIGGELDSWSFDDTTGVFQIRLRAIPWVTAPTVLAFPADRVYPGGFRIEGFEVEEAEGYEVDEAARELRFDVDRTGAWHTVRIRPQ